MDFKKYVIDVLQTEMEAISLIINDASNDYDQICRLILQCSGKVVFMGVGKSGHIGKKLAATFASTGTPSFFVHCTESVHGDLGMIQNNDLGIILSNSGNTSEVVNVISHLKGIGCQTIAFTADKNSILAKECDYILSYPKVPEADHLNLAPTTSTTQMLSLGDAVACAVCKARGFKHQDFLKYHPGGSLGAMLQDKLSG